MRSPLWLAKGGGGTAGEEVETTQGHVAWRLAHGENFGSQSPMRQENHRTASGGQQEGGVVTHVLTGLF